MSIDLLEIRHAVIICQGEEKTWRVPFELQIWPEDQTWRLLNCHGEVYPMGTEISVDAAIHMQDKRLHLTLLSEGVQLEKLSDFSLLIPELMAWGNADISGEADLQFSPFAFTDARADCTLHSGTITHPRFTLRNAVSAENDPLPFHLEITRGDQGDWALTGTEIAMVSPLPLTLSDLECRFFMKENSFDSSGKVMVTTGPDFAKYLPAVETLPVLRSSADFSAAKAESWQWGFSLSKAATNAAVSIDRHFKASAGSFEMAAVKPELEISGKGTGSAGAASYRLVLPRVNIAGTSENIDIPVVSLTGKADFQYADGQYRGHSNYKLRALSSEAVFGTTNVYTADILLTGKADFRHSNGQFHGDTDFSLTASDTELKSDTTTITMPGLSLAGSLGTDTGEGHRFRGTLEFSDTTLLHEWHNTAVSGVHGNVPLIWPRENVPSEGSIFIESIHWDKKSLGSVRGSLQQKETGFFFKGKHDSLLFPDLALDIAVDSHIFSPRGTETKIRFELPPYTPPSEIDLGRLLPWIQGIMIRGEMALKGAVRMDHTGVDGWLDTSLDNASIRYPAEDILIDGIQLSLSFPDLLHLRTAPKQKFTFQNASLSGLSVTEGKIEFQIEGPGSFFLERSSFRWCGGNIDTQAMRIVPGVHDYDMVLYCDRLSFAKILEQTGVISATGTGTLNGRIPIRFKDGMITIQDGFLFSTPGEGGKISITGANILNALIPSDTLQIGQLEIAKEAIKDYDYEWAKLWLNTEEDTLLMKLQLEGKPAGRLPFVYNKQEGRFIKVDAESKGSIFQGIRLDVNFRLPCNNVLYYGDIIREIYKMAD